MKKNKKIVYETPTLIPLGELARGLGAKPPKPCANGNKADLACGAGTSFGVIIPKPQCKNGSLATGRCASGASGTP